MKGVDFMKTLLKVCLIIIGFAVTCEFAPLLILGLIIAVLVMGGTPKENAIKILDKTKDLIN
jgi:hypothetical protein